MKPVGIQQHLLAFNGVCVSAILSRTPDIPAIHPRREGRRCWWENGELLSGMAPRKRTSSASTSRNSSQNQSQASQRTKFGIQHFFDRHSETSCLISNRTTASNRAGNDLVKSDENAAPENLLQDAVCNVPGADQDQADTSPKVIKAMPLKRFKFSPGMLIKQSQDEGGDEVTWRISPVNERLRSAAKYLPDTSTVLRDASNRGVSALRLCSLKQGLPFGKYRKRSISSFLKVSETSLDLTRRVASQESGIDDATNSYLSCEIADAPNIISNANQQSPFVTPPSIPYGSIEHANISCRDNEDQLEPQRHRKALLHLLDQVENAISNEDPVCKSSSCSGIDQECNTCLPSNHLLKNVPTEFSLEGGQCNSNTNFLVLEVSEKDGDLPDTQHPYKVLRLLNEQNGDECKLQLEDEWFCSHIYPGDTVAVIGEFDQHGKCVVDHDYNFIIVHPEMLLSGTRVASSLACSRRAVLDERLKITEHSSAALIGTLIHRIFQAALLMECPVREDLEDHVKLVIQKSSEKLYACGVSEAHAYTALMEAIPKILNWLISFRSSQHRLSSLAFGLNAGQREICITEVMDIEESAWAPKYGLKGVIDASVMVCLKSDCGCQEAVMPLEFKTGKSTSGPSAIEHSAQVILYTILMSERYQKCIDSGLIYYLQMDETRGIAVQRSDLVGLIMRRNEFATDILRALKGQELPPMVQNPSMCKNCRHLSACTVFHKALGGSMENSGLSDVFGLHVDHLTARDYEFLRKWDRLIDLEARESQDMRWTSSFRREQSTKFCGYFSLVSLNERQSEHFLANDGFIYCFEKKDPYSFSQEIKSDNLPEPKRSLMNSSCCSVRHGDFVVLSARSPHIIVAKGVVDDASHSHISVIFSRHLRLPGRKSTIDDLKNEIWQIQKDEMTSSFAIMRYNLVTLFLQSERSSQLRKIIVDLEPPRFDSGGIFSQDPAVSYVRSEKGLNSDQQKAIQKVLSAKDYALILGMPGTGKTSTMVHAVKALLMRGASILLTSYTNSAVDNLLMKLKSQGIDFIRLGRYDAVHEEIRDYCFPGLKVQSVDDIKLKMNQVKVVGVTCLGVHHSLLANRRFDVCIMDEAGQTTLPVSLGPLLLSSSFVLVGDPYQLPPLIQSAEARENGMGKSLFSRLSEAHPQAVSALQCQYRMCDDIMQLSNVLIYGNKLCCGSSKVASAQLKIVSERPIPLWLNQILDPKSSVVFANTDLLPAPEAKEYGNVNNPCEAMVVAEIVGLLVDGGAAVDQIGVITPYNSQANLIRKALEPLSVEVHTIDKYQGRDKDCILISFVRSSDNPNTCCSTLLGDWRRINVAITRAKAKLIMVGSCRTLSKIPLLKLLIEKIEEQSGIVDVSEIHIESRGLRKCSRTR